MHEHAASDFPHERDHEGEGTFHFTVSLEKDLSKAPASLPSGELEGLLDAVCRAMARELPAVPVPHGMEEAAQPHTGLHLLLAEDNPVNQRLAARLLEKMGHRVVVANNGREAIEAAERQTFAAVLMDVQMPETDGFRATAAIRARERVLGLPRTPIIGVTAHAMKGDRERCLDAGMDAYGSKPIKTAELREVLERLATPTAAPTVA